MDGLLGVLPALRAKLDEKMKDEKAQRKLVLVCVCIALLLDNMLYMVGSAAEAVHFARHA
jgi:hypothetical protein